MAYSKLVPFDRPMTGAAIAGNAGRFYTEQELAARDDAAYRRGVDATRSLADQQMVELRADIGQLADGLFQKLTVVQPALVNQLRDSLPGLALDIAKRLLAGFEPSPEVISRLCEEALAELFPERDNLELVVCVQDAELLNKLNPDWLRRYPGLRIRAEAALRPGDCQVRSRFGLTDARLAVKLATLEHSLMPT